MLKPGSLEEQFESTPMRNAEVIMTNRSVWSILIVAELVCAWPSSSTAEIHEVIVQNFNFSQNDLTIAAGDTVRWTNVQGFHDVTEDQFSWSSGTGFDWVYERQFDQTGVVLYHCTVHSGPGQPIQTSMNGRITITASTVPALFEDGFESDASTTLQGANK